MKYNTLITGGNSGIGLALVRSYLKKIGASTQHSIESTGNFLSADNGEKLKW